jgi:hypothetical protein
MTVVASCDAQRYVAAADAAKNLRIWDTAGSAEGEPGPWQCVFHATLPKVKRPVAWPSQVACKPDSGRRRSNSTCSGSCGWARSAARLRAWSRRATACSCSSRPTAWVHRSLACLRA